MNAILIIAHAPLASALRSAALHALPYAAERLMAMDVSPKQAPNTCLKKARAMLGKAALAPGIRGTLVMSDVLGATPCNVAARLLGEAHVQCVTGASLPMLLRAITYWDEPLADMATKALLGSSLGAVAINSKHDVLDHLI